MSDSMNSTKRASRKAKALLAGGLVLGVGAAVTLASWTDQEWASGIFSTGTFEIETSVDGENFDHPPHQITNGEAALQFDLTGTGATNMYPGQTIAAPFAMRLTDDTTYNANVKLKEASTTTHPNVEHLSYGIVQVEDSVGCVPDATGMKEIVSAGTALNSIGDAATFNLQSGDESEAGSPITLCFQITAGEGLQQLTESESKRLTATWKFDGQSVTE